MSENYRPAALFGCASSKWDLPICVLESTGRVWLEQTHPSPPLRTDGLSLGSPIIGSPIARRPLQLATC